MTHQQAYDNHLDIIKNYVHILYTFLNRNVASNVQEVTEIGDKLQTTLSHNSLIQLSNKITIYYNTLMDQHLSLLLDYYSDTAIDDAAIETVARHENTTAGLTGADVASFENDNEIGYSTRRIESISRPIADVNVRDFTATEASEYLNFFSRNVAMFKPFAICFLYCLINLQTVHEITMKSLTEIYSLIEHFQDDLLFKMLRIHIESPSNTKLDRKYSVDVADKDNLDFIIRYVRNNIQYADTRSTPYESVKSVYDRSATDRFNILHTILRIVHDDCKGFLKLLPESVKATITSAYNNFNAKRLVYIPIDGDSDLNEMPAIRNFFIEYNKLVSEHVRMTPIVARSGTKRPIQTVNRDDETENDYDDDSDAASNVRRRRVDDDYTLSRRKLKNIKPLSTSKFLERTLKAYTIDGTDAIMTLPPLLRAINETVGATYKSVFNCVPNEMLCAINYFNYNKNTIRSMDLSNFDYNVNFYRLLMPLTHYGTEETTKSRCVWFIAKSHLYFINNAKDFDDIKQSIPADEPNREQKAMFMIKYQFLWFYNKFVQNQLADATVNKFQNPSLFQVVQLYNNIVMNCYVSLRMAAGDTTTARSVDAGDNKNTAHERLFKVMSGYF